MLNVNRITKSFNLSSVLKDITISIAPGERVAHAAIDDDDSDVGKALPLLLTQCRVGEGGEQRSQAQYP